MHSTWTKHIKEQEAKKSFIEHIRNSSLVLDRIKVYMKEKLTEHEVPPAADYDSPSWAYKQADRNGYLRAMNDVYNFINLDQRKDG